jgi:hypothetical protein
LGFFLLFFLMLLKMFLLLILLWGKVFSFFMTIQIHSRSLLSIEEFRTTYTKSPLFLFDNGYYIEEQNQNK